MSSYVLDQHGESLLDHVPLHRFGGPDDLKGAVVYLASRASDFMTGQTLIVDGGQSAW
jgi:gluconate 5-dehydrogenase